MTLIDRPAYLEKLIRQKDKDIIKVITGVRRCGKSVLLFDIFYRYLLECGIDDSHIIKINLENKENESLRNADSLYRHILEKITDDPSDQKYYVMIDEIPYVDGFEDLVNSLKNRKCDVYITGSNSKLLSKDISTALRGRSIEIHVFTLSFREYYSYVGGDKRDALNQYLLYGGFPYAATEPDPSDKIDYLKMLGNTIAVKDIIERHNIRNEDAFIAVYDFVCSAIGSAISPKKISDTLKSNGHKTISPETVGNYMTYLCDSFLFRKVCRYDVRGRQYLKTLYKFYASDIGLRNAELNFRQIEPTHALENIIYIELVRRGYMVDIGKNNDKEIDFVASDTKNTYYIQSAYSITDPAKKEQEIRSFRHLDDGYKKIIITMDDDPFTHIGNGYKKINILDFLLDEKSLETI